jgi:hypothetical protein
VKVKLKALNDYALTFFKFVRTEIHLCEYFPVLNVDNKLGKNEWGIFLFLNFL